MTVAESLNLEIGVLDQFEDDLLKLSGMLEGIGEQADALDPIRIDVDVNDRELQELQGQLAATEAADAVDGGMTPRVPAGDGGAATATTDGGGSGFLDRTDIRELDTSFGQAFDRESLIGSGGEVTAPTQLLEGGIAEYIDIDDAFEKVLSDESDLDLDVLSGLTGNDMGDFTDSLETLKDLDLTDLPTERRTMIERLQRMNLNMGHFYDLLASLLPLLGVYIGAIPAAITAMGTLAAAAIGAAGGLAAIAGLGAIGFAMSQNGGGMPSMEDFQDILSDIRDDAFEAFSPLAQQLAPMFKKGLNGLERFFDALAAQGDVLLELRDEAEAFGGFLIDYVPTAIGNLVRLGEAASGVFASIGGFFSDLNLSQTLATELAGMLPTLARFSALIVEALPAILEYSEGFLDVAFAITAFVFMLGKAIRTILTLNGILPWSDKLVGMLVGSIFTLITATAILVKTQALLGGTWVASAASAIPAYISSLTGLTAAEIQAAVAGTWLRRVLLSLGVGIALFAVGKLTNQFIGLDNSIRNATGSLRDFGKMSGRLDSGGVGIGGTSGGVERGAYINYTDNQTTNIQAPDTETGTAVANYKQYVGNTSTDTYFSQ